MHPGLGLLLNIVGRGHKFVGAGMLRSSLVSGFLSYHSHGVPDIRQHRRCVRQFLKHQGYISARDSVGSVTSIFGSDSEIQPEEVVDSQAVGKLLADLEKCMDSEAGRSRAQALLFRWRVVTGETTGEVDADWNAKAEDMPGDEAEQGMPDVCAALAANSAFYEAFNAKDIEAMSQVWASGDVSCECVHPERPRLRGREEVLASWGRVLSAKTFPSATVSSQQVLLAIDGGAVVICTEETDDGGCLEATNTFRRCREDGGWRCVGHHVGPVVGGAGGYLLALLGQGFKTLMPWSDSSSSVSSVPMGIPVLSRWRREDSERRIPGRGEASEKDLSSESAAREAVEALLVDVEARAPREEEKLRAQALRLRWQAAALELDREAEELQVEGTAADDDTEMIKVVESAALAANAAFYRAFNARNATAMGHLWASECTTSACTHPGKLRLQGREAVLSSWELVLGGRSTPELTITDTRVLLATSGGAVVVCTEEFSSGGFLEATNTFARGPCGNLFMVGHHSG